MSDLTAIRDRLRTFADARNWNQFHTPKNLSMAIAGEAGELLAEFQWLTPEESSRLTAEKLRDVEMEIAIAQMTEGYRPRPRYKLLNACADIVDQLRHRR